MAISPDGRRIVAVSDRLRWMTADIAYDGNSPAGLKNASIGVLAPADPEMLGVGHDRDAEAISLLGGTPDEGEFLVSFERLSRLARIRKTGDVWSPVSAYLKTPDEVKSFGANTGFEAATVIAGGPQKGTIVAIAENYPDARGHHSGWLWVDGEPLPFALTVTPGYAISDAVSLDNGALVVLERHASWLGSFAMRLRYIAPGSIRPGAVVEGALLMQAEGSEEIDNMEAISVHRNAANETILTLMSDDNFNYLERTMLLQFALPETYARR